MGSTSSLVSYVVDLEGTALSAGPWLGGFPTLSTTRPPRHFDDSVLERLGLR